MFSKLKRPFCLGMLLGILLGMLIMLLAIAPDNVDSDKKKPVALLDQPIIKQQNIADNAPKYVDSVELSDSVIQSLETVKHLAEVDAAKEKSEQAEDLSITIDEQEVMQKPVPLALKKGHGIALLLDDVGYDLAAVERILSLSVPVTISILPGSPFARQAAMLAKQSGHVVMLHLPMQPTDASLRMNDDFLQDTMSEQTVRDIFLRHLDAIPYVEGVNNHMGSKLTQLNGPMNWVMQVCREKGLFFVDSRTSAKSVAAKEAKKAGVAWASRSIFLDHDMNLESMQKAWERARRCAKKKLACIVIAHPRAKTVTFLENYLNKEDAANMVSVKHLLRSMPINSQASASR